MVIYRGIDGKPGYHQTDDIHDAIGFVEQMRNEEGVEHARIFRLEEVVFEYRPYYRVELSTAGQPSMSLTGAPPSQLAGGADPAAPLEPGVPASAYGETPESIDLADEVIDVAEGLDRADGFDRAAGLDRSDSLDPAESFEAVESKITADAGGAKKGLFGR
jgi:hypothetical protein